MDMEYRERLERDAELDRLRVENAALKARLHAYERLDEKQRQQEFLSRNNPMIGSGIYQSMCNDGRNHFVQRLAREMFEA